MEYGVHRFFDIMKEQRKDRPNMENLPPKCCANCEEWCNFADDCCERYVSLESEDRT